MTHNDLYCSAKSDVEALANPLFDFSQQCLKARGNFLPHGAVLKNDRTVELVAAASNGMEGRSTSLEVLPLLHDGLRERVCTFSALAIGVAENVTITLEGQKPTPAIKVSIEHENGLSVALYLPFQKRLFRSHIFGNMFAKQMQPEVGAFGKNTA
jgi:hypothetical protein